MLMTSMPTVMVVMMVFRAERWEGGAFAEKSHGVLTCEDLVTNTTLGGGGGSLFTLVIV